MSPVIKLHAVNVTSDEDQLTMSRATQQRKRRFRIALAAAGMSAAAWAEQEGISPGHLSAVLDGKRDSRTLTDKIDSFTAKQLATVHAS